MKKAQIQMMETIAVLFIFFILIVLGFVFYGNVLKGSVANQQEQAQQLQSIELAQRVSTLAELQCSDDNIVSDNCIDVLKLEAASRIITQPANEIYYYDRLLFSEVKVQEIYPEATNEWILYSNPLEEFSSKIVSNIPISLRDPITKKHAFGVMVVELYLP